MIEPNNTGTVSDDSQVHKTKAKELIQYGTGHYLAENLKLPLLVPTFDRPKSNFKMYTHALDSDTLKNEKGKLKRIDLQLLAMIEDAKDKLKNRNIEIREKVFLYGFSASGNFVNRFSIIHPKVVKAVTAGGVNGMPILPIKEINGLELPYHIGVNNLDEIIDQKFNVGEYKKVAQLIFMGENDNNDTLPFDDAFSEKERSIVKEVLGDEMKERWQISKKYIKNKILMLHLLLIKMLDILSMKP